MEVNQATCSGSDCPHPPPLWGAALPLGRGRGGESALQSKKGAAKQASSLGCRGQLGQGHLEQEMLHTGPCLWYCTLLLQPPCPGIPCFC